MEDRLRASLWNLSVIVDEVSDFDKNLSNFFLDSLSFIAYIGYIIMPYIPVSQKTSPYFVRIFNKYWPIFTARCT